MLDFVLADVVVEETERALARKLSRGFGSGRRLKEEYRFLLKRLNACCEDALLRLVQEHLPPLRAEGLVTDRASIMMRTANGTIIEVFEWVSQEAIAGAHTNPAVLELWRRFEAVCSYEIPSNVAEFKTMFAHFESV